MKPARVLIVDEHPVTRKGIQWIASTDPTLQIVGEAENGAEAIRQAHILQPDLVLMDLLTPPESGIQTIVELKRRYPNLKVIVLTRFEDINLIKAVMAAGADGYLLKETAIETLRQALQAVQQGGMPLHPRVARQLIGEVTKHKAIHSPSHLTGRQKEVLQLVARGLSNKEVAQALNLSEGTVKIHVGHILDKLNLSRRTEAAVWAVQMGLVFLQEEQ